MSISPELREARRRLLVDAAHALIQENGDAGFSMAQLAARARVSPATPYNLVGPKSEVLRLIVLDVFDGFRERLAALRATDGLARLLGAVDCVVDHYTADPAFYAGLYRTAQGGDRAQIGSRMFAEGRSLWSELVAAAHAEGTLQPFVEVELLTDVLLRTMSITTEFWLSSGWSAPRFQQEMAHAARLLLAAVASETSRPALVADIARLQARLAAADTPKARRRA